MLCRTYSSEVSLSWRVEAQAFPASSTFFPCSVASSYHAVCCVLKYPARIEFLRASNWSRNSIFFRVGLAYILVISMGPGLMKIGSERSCCSMSVVIEGEILRSLRIYVVHLGLSPEE